MKTTKPLAALSLGGMILLGAGTAYAASSSQPFGSAGTGTETSLSASGCQFTTAGCTVRTSGTAVTLHMGIGPYQSVLTVDWADATSNGAGGFCAPASGTGTISAADGDQLDQTESGTVCEVGPSTGAAPHSFSGTFTDSGGTGRFAAATGSGTVTGGDDGVGHAGYVESGSINY